MPRLFDIDISAIPDAEIPATLAQLAALQTAIAARLASTKPGPGSETLLTVEEAACKLSVTEDWLYRRGKKLGLAVKLGDGTLRFSASAIDNYIRGQTAGPAPTRRRKLRVDKGDSFIS